MSEKPGSGILPSSWFDLISSSKSAASWSKWSKTCWFCRRKGGSFSTSGLFWGDSAGLPNSIYAEGVPSSIRTSYGGIDIGIFGCLSSLFARLKPSKYLFISSSASFFVIYLPLSDFSFFGDFSTFSSFSSSVFDIDLSGIFSSGSASLWLAGSSCYFIYWFNCQEIKL